MIKSARMLLENDFNEDCRRYLASSITKGYSCVNDLRSSTEFLLFPSGDNVVPYLINAAVEYEVYSNILADNLAYDYRFVYNSVRSHKHLEVKTENSILTISQVHRKNQVPRNALFRKNLKLHNYKYLSLFEDITPINSEEYYVLLTHGHQGDSPQFINLGVPSPINNSWLAKYDIMSEFISKIEESTEEHEEKLVELKEHLKKVLVNDEQI